ncbi:hypothetical protein LXA47_22660 [Massilia sp. P8910]|uniref:Carboxypeptidase regulatory-like domain-containing protein n=1 Tax=Massilia antarctica TaxID=2765360 RepID=A0AA49A6H4_9BURK|nr:MULTISPECIES: hypothetical protein [Massilia]CUI09282.1 hypothetical protein BN2497_13341 [Janthinobacterium sp. CG23_2]MCE3606384.1 hypothetical protein [Massilia antarctica]MCY0910377.1 hypothetical protein [Massilia sp. H27-R4]QPI48259.1 hypothetical protein IV454_22305 [Massilia antarctica]CUU33068.1 hypothetical protein BN3177_13341 [Janthinobacterium sp. CG23_2]
MKKPTSMLLEANFDINQIGETLEWKFSRKDGDGNPVTGRYAGAIYFTMGELVHIKVRAGGYEQFESFKVLDCSLITRPQIVCIAPGQLAAYARPSPFDGVAGACVSVAADEFGPGHAHASEEGGRKYHTISRKWDQFLTVGDDSGRWEVSFVLTVEITRCSGRQERRVFAFDPEGVVGAGVTPPDMDDSGDGMACMPEGDVNGGVPA